MKTIIEISIGVIILFFLSTPKINFKPFSISFETPLVSFAVFFLVLSLILFQVNSEKIGRKKGFKEGVEKCIKIIKETPIEK